MCGDLHPLDKDSVSTRGGRIFRRGTESPFGIGEAVRKGLKCQDLAIRRQLQPLEKEPGPERKGLTDRIDEDCPCKYSNKLAISLGNLWR